MELKGRSYNHHIIHPCTDEQLQELYPAQIQAMALKHWTPAEITRNVVQYLVPANEGSKVLDIGSGAGHFCLAAACYKPQAYFFGVEQRRALLRYSEDARIKLGVKNVFFIQGNFTRLDFRKFDHFYFYNSFYENLNGTDKIDDSIAYSNELYSYYNLYLSKKLEEMPKGTKIATFHSLDFEIPPGYVLVKTIAAGRLKFWIKENSRG